MQAIRKLNKARQRRAAPEKMVTEYRRDSTTTSFVFFRHRQREFQKRKSQRFVIAPLRAQQNREARQHRIRRQNQRAPRRQRQQPNLPWNCAAIAQKPLRCGMFSGDVVAVHQRGRKPMFQIRQQKFERFVFGIGKIKRGNQARHEEIFRTMSGHQTRK